MGCIASAGGAEPLVPLHQAAPCGPFGHQEGHQGSEPAGGAGTGRNAKGHRVDREGVSLGGE